VCRAIGISESSFYRWRERYAGMSVPDAKHLRELERENAILKRLLAEAELEKVALKVIAQGKWGSPHLPVGGSMVMPPQLR
jgi:putative transposase